VNEQPKFIEKAKDTYRFHREKLLSNDNWNSTKTAKALRRSIGSINEDLQIARWCKTHEKQIERFKYTYEALEYIREMKNKQELDEV